MCLSGMRLAGWVNPQFNLHPMGLTSIKTGPWDYLGGIIWVILCTLVVSTHMLPTYDLSDNPDKTWIP